MRSSADSGAAKQTVELTNERYPLILLKPITAGRSGLTSAHRSESKTIR